MIDKELSQVMKRLYKLNGLGRGDAEKLGV